LFGSWLALYLYADLMEKEEEVITKKISCLLGVLIYSKLGFFMADSLILAVLRSPPWGI
jgi:hypothetical protein